MNLKSTATFLNSWIGTILQVWLMIYLLSKAAAFGQIWDGVANPRPGVDIGLGEKKYHGTLGRDWNADYILTLESGEEIHFKEFSWMSVKLDQNRDNSITKYWRSIFPPFIVIAIFLFITAWSFFESRKSDADTSEKSE